MKYAYRGAGKGEWSEADTMSIVSDLTMGHESLIPEEAFVRAFDEMLPVGQDAYDKVTPAMIPNPKTKLNLVTRL